MGVINFGWLVVRVPSPDWLYRIFVLRDVCQVLRWSRHATTFALQLRKITENPSQGSRMALGCSMPNAIRFVDLAIADDGLDWPATPCRPWLSRQATGSTLGHLKYLPSCRTGGFLHRLTLSPSSRSGLWCCRQTAESPDPHVSLCYLRTEGYQ